MTAASSTRWKPLQTTARDLSVLDALTSYRFLSIPQLAALFFPTWRAASDRLRRLYEHGLVVRVFVPVRPHDRQSYTVYALGAKGARLITPRHNGVRPHHLSPKEQRSGLFLEHTLARNDLRVALTLLDRRRDDIALVHWAQTPEVVRASTRLRIHPHREERVSIIPDGLFVLDHRRRREGFAVEIDMGTVPLPRMALRYRAYWHFWRSGGARARWGTQPFRVLTLTTTPRRLDALRRMAARAPAPSGPGSGLFWFALLPTASIDTPERLLSRTWRVARPHDNDLHPLFE